jgi:hypothetical protein
MMALLLATMQERYSIATNVTSRIGKYFEAGYKFKRRANKNKKP